MATAQWTTANNIGEREQLSDVIYRVDPAETPIFSNAKKQTVRGTFVEWQVQELTAASASNALTEGADTTYATPTPTTRLGNYCQISGKNASISGTVDVVEKAGRDSEVAYQKVQKALELRRDIDKILCTPQARSSSEPRKAGTLAAWITNVDDNGATNASGDGTDYNGETTSGTARALALSYIDNAMKDAYTDGGQPDMLVVSPANKVNFSDLAIAATGAVTNEYNMTSPREGTLVGSVSVYMTDFGALQCVIDRQMPDNAVYLLDTEYYSVGTLSGRNFKTEPLAKTGDAERFHIITEWTLLMQAPKAHGAVYALSGS